MSETESNDPQSTITALKEKAEEIDKKIEETKESILEEQDRARKLSEELRILSQESDKNQLEISKLQQSIESDDNNFIVNYLEKTKLNYLINRQNVIRELKEEYNKKIEVLKKAIASSKAYIQSQEKSKSSAIKEAQEYESFLANHAFEEQSFLTANIEHLAKEGSNIDRLKSIKLYRLLEEIDISSITYDKLIMLSDSSPFTFLTKMTQYPTTNYMFDAQNYELSSIVPMIKLYKVFNDTDDEFQIPFEVNSGVGDWATPVDSLKNRGTRAIGIGIKSFSAKLNGNNPFAVKKSISANLQIYAASFSELARERTYNGNKFRYLDLALKTGKNPNTKTPNDILNFRLKAVIGWSKPRINNVLYNEKFINAINKSYITLNLSPIIHKFTFDETGAVIFDIEYLSYIDDFFEQPVFNIFSSGRYQNLKAKHNANIEELKNNKCKAKSTQEKEQLDRDFDKGNKEFENKLTNLKKSTLQQIIMALSEAERIYSINIPIEKLFKMSKKGYAGFFNDQNDTDIGIADKSVKNQVDDILQTSSTQSSGNGTQSSFSPFINLNTHNILFFYTRDLFDVVIALLDDKLSELKGEDSLLIYNYYKKLKLILGPIEIKDNESSKKIYNIGNIPISLNSYLSWMTTRVITTERDEYPFLAFCRSFFNEFVTSQMNSSNSYSQRVNLRENFITSYNDLGTDFKNNSITTNTFGDYDITTINLQKPYLKVSGPNKDTRSNLDNKEEFHYLIFDASESIPSDSLKGNYTDNMNNGVFHFISGRQEGIVKQINFTATSATGLAEVRFEQEGYNGLYQLMSVYDVDITTIGMFNIYPGCTIYVDPRGLEPTITDSKGKKILDGFDLTNLGIGGYCIVIDVSHQLEAGVCETKIIARWVASKDKSYFNQIIAKENATDVDVSCSNPEGDRQ